MASRKSSLHEGPKWLRLTTGIAKLMMGWINNNVESIQVFVMGLRAPKIFLTKEDASSSIGLHMTEKNTDSLNLNFTDAKICDVVRAVGNFEVIRCSRLIFKEGTA
jgi:hypothetical protein